MSAKVKKGENPEEEKEGKKKKSKLTLIILGIPVILAILMVALVPLIAISGGSVIYAGYQVLKEKVLDGVEHFTERIKNLFTGYGWQTDDKAAQKQEELYYKELERVYDDYIEHYEVEINPTLITATLYYGYSGVDFGYNCQDENCSINQYHNNNEPDARFWKNARSKIVSLAELMVAHNTIKMACNGEESRVDPDNIKDLAAQDRTHFLIQFWGGLTHDGSQFAQRYILMHQEQNPEGTFPTYDYCDMHESVNYGLSDEQTILKLAYEYVGDAVEQNRSRQANIDKYLRIVNECASDPSSHPKDTCDNAITALAQARSMPEIDINNLLQEYDNINAYVKYENGDLVFVCPDYFYSGHGKCQKYYYDEEVNTAEWFIEGLYYYKLQNAYGWFNNQSFLQKYYHDFLNEHTDQEEFTEDMFYYYETYLRNMERYRGEYESGLMLPAKYHSSTVFNERWDGVYGTLFGAGEWTTWTQGDPRWGHMLMYTETLREAGCAFTSQTIMLAKMMYEGHKLDLSPVGGELNPYNYLIAYKSDKVGGYRGTNSIYWGLVTKVFPTVKHVYRGHSLNDLAYALNKGYYCIIHVRHYGRADYSHYVAVAGMENGVVWTYDPGVPHDGSTKLTERNYNETRQVECYSVDS